jgi:preprotein translocase subunit SecG
LYGLVLAIHVIVCVLLVVVVLLQSGKSADLAGAFGGAGSQSTFGPRGTASFLSKMTTTLAIMFMVTSLSLWIIAANRSETSSTDGLKTRPRLPKRLPPLTRKKELKQEIPQEQNSSKRQENHRQQQQTPGLPVKINPQVPKRIRPAKKNRRPTLPVVIQSNRLSYPPKKI